jgi:hypothetical protein
VGKAQSEVEGLPVHDGLPVNPLAAGEGAAAAAPPCCARSQASDTVLRRGLKAPDALAAALRKRLFVQALPYLVTSSTCAGKLLPPPAKRGRSSGREFEQCQAVVHQQQQVEQQVQQQVGDSIKAAIAKACSVPVGGAACGGEAAAASTSVTSQQVVHAVQCSALAAAVAAAGSSSCGGQQPRPRGMSQLQRYQQMKSSLRDRVASGKSAIHGLGVFAKVPHRAGEVMHPAAGEDRLEDLLCCSAAPA